MQYDIQVKGNHVNGGFLFESYQPTVEKVRELITQGGIPTCDIRITKTDKDIHGNPYKIILTDKILNKIEKENLPTTKTECSKCEYSYYDGEGFSCTKGHKEEYQFLAHVWCEDYKLLAPPF